MNRSVERKGLALLSHFVSWNNPPPAWPFNGNILPRPRNVTVPPPRAAVSLPPPPPPPPPAVKEDEEQEAAEEVKSALRWQVEYYFSKDNLVKDEFLRRQMNEKGWVSLETIAAFPRVVSLTTDVSLILEALRDSSSVEVADGNLRRRDDWELWPIPLQPDDAAA